MSAIINAAEKIKARLKKAPASNEFQTPVDLTRVDVIVDRQKNINSMVAAAVAKASGICITILFTGFRNLDKNASRPRLACTYTVRVWALPVLQQGNFSADEVMASMILRLWQWVPDGGHAHGEADVRNGDIIGDASYLCYETEIVVPVNL